MQDSNISSSKFRSSKITKSNSSFSRLDESPFFLKSKSIRQTFYPICGAIKHF